MKSFYLREIDVRIILVIFCLMVVSLIIISSFSIPLYGEEGEIGFFTPLVQSQIQWFALGWIAYFVCARIDYRKLREWTWFIYALMILSLLGLFFTEAIQNVHRWYRIPILHATFQPSECAKLSVVIALSWLLEKRKGYLDKWRTALYVAIIVGIPFLLILKQPDLGTALILYPIVLIMSYFGSLPNLLMRFLVIGGAIAIIIVGAIFSGGIPYESLKPYTKGFLKDYQFARLNPKTPHQQAASIAIAIGGFKGKGWRQGEFSRGGWLPKPYTDSVFPAFGEEFGFLGLLFVLILYYALLYFTFQIAIIAKDTFGCFLAMGIGAYLAMHILVNVGMMCGFLPITGVPLILISYGGSSILATMMALGLLQSIYSRRFTF